ncbi:hypothetical protein AVEN_242545-1 [Araneus ventricosus]|uniref:Uncharacterized protein n=1 Tax=Araneus ventricosus TaxID=182803 RepID=A0A4Y2S128_ARAVE|nr:hypothetical protein AVEN_7881-1 [Araneus ventricosus]GBN78589.1 hypothetical protein AVEN_133617-1 [Araneus ventricosus]GBN80884.1 hypothetical protein AVEN_190047-1 [Araneus ventricosus]GBN80900.1 hypothetical protein AVEN_242545-1 [Araneus ventricosus]
MDRQVRLRDWRVPGSKPDSIENLSLLLVKLYVVGQTSSYWCVTLHQFRPAQSGVRPSNRTLVWYGNLEMGYQLRCCPRQLTVALNNEVRPKIVPVLLQNGTLI